MILVLAGIILVAIAVPHRLRLDQATPVTATWIWLSTLTLCALTAIFSAIFIILYLPATETFRLLSQWCWHTVLPLLAAHLGFDGHDLGDAALVAPSFALALSMLSVIFGLWRAARRVHQLILTAIGSGPGDSVLLGGEQVLIAAAGVRRPRVVVSAGALTAFDDEELAASLDHERGHIERRHRYVLIYAELCRGLGRFVPGTRTAARELAFHLERDADGFALGRRHDPAALASAICKAADSQLLAAPSFSLAGGNVARRVQGLLDGGPTKSALQLRAISFVLASLAMVAIATLPTAAHAGWHQAGSAAPSHHCPH